MPNCSENERAVLIINIPSSFVFLSVEIFQKTGSERSEIAINPELHPPNPSPLEE